MVRIKSTDDLIQEGVDYFRLAQPNLDTKPGTVSRDVFINGPSNRTAGLYRELATIQTAQSLRLASGSNLERLASNFSIFRNQGSRASGTAILTFNDLSANVAISAGDTVVAANGLSFTVQNSLTISAQNKNTYRAIASKYRADLDFVGITDEFAAEVSVQAATSGTNGNVAKYGLDTTNISGVSNVTNVLSFSGGTDPETDAQLRNRALAVYRGSSAGTEQGYENQVLIDPAVIDAIVVSAGDPLMTRDGTQVTELEDGTQIITEEGTGGKIDIYVYGSRNVESVSSVIYRDQSGQNDPTNTANDFLLGQIEADAGKTVRQKRIDNLKNGVLPEQPVSSILTVTGSSSGANFIEKSTDSLGRVAGNYELIFDDGEFGGSPWGFDRLRWIDDNIRDLLENKSKGSFNGQDALGFSDVTKISGVTQNIAVFSENSQVDPTDRKIIQLSQFPISAVTRVLNFTTGERYVIVDQNPDGDGALNETGRIVISGSTLPATSDTLQVDYTWVFEYDPKYDFDNRINSDNPRAVLDSVDWGYSNVVRREESTVIVSGNSKTVEVTHNISSVISINTFVEEASIVSEIEGQKAVVLSDFVTNVIAIIRSSDETELFNTSDNNGSFSGVVVFLPTDTVAEVGDAVIIRYNATDIFSVDGVTGSFSGNVITIASGLNTTNGTIVEVTYIANVKRLLADVLIQSLPAVRNGNGFTTQATNLKGTQPSTFIFDANDNVVKNLRIAPSNLSLNIVGSISPGVLTVLGTTTDRIAEAVFTISANGLKHDLSSPIKDYLNLASGQSIGSNVFVSRLASFERVTTSGSEVLSVDNVYDIKGYKLKSNDFIKSESIRDVSLSRTEIELPSTPDNLSNQLQIGDRVRATFYISTSGDSENVSFSKSGTLFTNSKFAIIDAISVSSGFTSAQSQNAVLSITNMNQPIQGSRYNVVYDYTAPKSNERITVRYNRNDVIGSATETIEETRPINDDVLVKTANAVFVDLTMAIVIEDGFTNTAATILQNVRNAVNNGLNATELGTTVDSSDFVNIAYQVAGVTRARVTRFNLRGQTGLKLSISARKNEYITSNEIVIQREER